MMDAFWLMVRAVYNNDWFALVSIVLVVLAIPGYTVYLLYGWWTEWEVLRLYKDKRKTLCHNKGFIPTPPRCTDWVQVHKDFLTSLSKRNVRAIARLLAKGKLIDDPFHQWGAGFYSNLYLTSELTDIAKELHK
jgi:hypothetical protein